MKQLILNEERFGVKSITPLFKEKEEQGIAVISRYHYKDKDNVLFNLRSMRDGGYMFRMYDGHYCRLLINGKLMMSDTGLERISNKEFIDNANGRVLIAGLGLGLIIHNIIDREDISEIIVIEKYRDVIDLVSPKFTHPKLKIICADIFEWKPSKGEKFDTIYFDIWADIGTDNLEEMKKLSSKFKSFLNRLNPKCWMNSWMKEYLQKMKRRESRY